MTDQRQNDEARAEKSAMWVLVFYFALLLLTVSVAVWGLISNYGGKWLVYVALIAAACFGADIVRMIRKLRRPGS